MVHFSELFGFGLKTEILKHFLTKPTEKISASGLIKKTGLAKKTVFSAIKNYESMLLKKEKVGTSILYSLDFSKPLARQLKILYTLSVLLEEIPPDFDGQAFLFGSAARGEDTEQSDWDVLVISSKRLSFKNPRIKPVFFNPLEYSALARKDEAFFVSIEKNKVRVF